MEENKSGVASEHFPFAVLCELLPSDVYWGDSLTPDILREIAIAIEHHIQERNK